MKCQVAKELSDNWKKKKKPATTTTNNHITGRLLYDYMKTLMCCLLFPKQLESTYKTLLENTLLCYGDL